MKLACKSFLSSYFTSLLPTSIILTVFLLGAAFTDEDSSVSLLMAVFIFFMATTPAFAVTKGRSPFSTRWKAWVFSAGDALLIAVCAYALPHPTGGSTAEIFFFCLAMGFIFIAIGTLLIRGMRLASDEDRSSLKADAKLVSKHSPGLLFRIFLGIIPVSAILWTTLAIQNAVNFPSQDLHFIFGVAMSVLVITPCSLFPFIACAQSLRRVSEEASKSVGGAENYEAKAASN